METSVGGGRESGEDSGKITGKSEETVGTGDGSKFLYVRICDMNSVKNYDGERSGVKNSGCREMVASNVECQSTNNPEENANQREIVEMNEVNTPNGNSAVHSGSQMEASFSVCLNN